MYVTSGRVTGVAAKSSEQHEEIGKSRTKRDYQDCRKLYDWLTTRNPFRVPDKNLHSLSTGIVSIKNKDKVNAEEAEKVGQQIQNGLDNCFYSDAKIKRSEQVTTLESLQNTKATKDGVTMADPCKMFNRLITIASREDDLEPMFEYE